MDGRTKACNAPSEVKNLLNASVAVLHFFKETMIVNFAVGGTAPFGEILSEAQGHSRFIYTTPAVDASIVAEKQLSKKQPAGKVLLALQYSGATTVLALYVVVLCRAARRVRRFFLVVRASWYQVQ